MAASKAVERLMRGKQEPVRVVAMCTFEALQDYELGFRQFDVVSVLAQAQEVFPFLSPFFFSISSCREMRDERFFFFSDGIRTIFF